MESWNDCVVYVVCHGQRGVYQGTVFLAERDNITLVPVFHNGYPLPGRSVTINCSDIKKLTIIEAPYENEEEARCGTIPNTRENEKPLHSDDVQKPLLKRNTGNENQGNIVPCSSKKVRWVDENEAEYHESNYNRGTASNEEQYQCNEALASPSNDPIMQQEFDFELNPAPNDKKPTWEELNNSQKPDVLNQAAPMNSSMTYDVNVLPSSSSLNTALQVPDNNCDSLLYETDEGLVMPSVTAQLRKD